MDGWKTMLDINPDVSSSHSHLAAMPVAHNKLLDRNMIINAKLEILICYWYATAPYPASSNNTGKTFTVIN